MKFKNFKKSFGFLVVLVIVLQVVILSPAAAFGIGVVVSGNGTGTGLTGTYYNDMGASQFVSTNPNQAVNFNWGTNQPTSGVGNNSYSVIWTGKIQPKYNNEPITFYTLTAGGVRLYVDGQLLIDNWTDHDATENRATTKYNLQSNQQYDIRLEYYNNIRNSVVKLLWESPSLAKEIIPTTQMFESKGTTVGYDTLRYVPLASAQDLIPTEVTKGFERGNYSVAGINTKYPEADSFVVNVISDKWSSASGQVTINGQTINMGTGDQGASGKWDISFYYGTNYNAWWNYGKVALKSQNFKNNGVLEVSNLADVGIKNDDIDSIQFNTKNDDGSIITDPNINKNVKIILYEDANFKGNNYTITGNCSDLDNIDTNGDGKVNEYDLKLRNKVSSFKIIPAAHNGASVAPVTSSTMVVPKNSGNMVISWQDFVPTGDSNDTVNLKRDGSIKVQLLGYFSKTQGTNFNFFVGSGYATLDGTDNQTKVIDTGLTEARAYIVEVTADRLSSDAAEVKVNGISTYLGTSDSNTGGTKAGALYSPVNTKTLFIPAVSDGKTITVSSDFSKCTWKVGNDARKTGGTVTPKITVKVLGYFTNGTGMTYKQTFQGGSTPIIHTIDTKVNTEQSIDIKTDCNYVAGAVAPKAYLLKVATNAGSDVVGATINQTKVNISTSATESGNGTTPVAAKKSQMVIVQASSSDALNLKVTPFIGDVVRDAVKTSTNVKDSSDTLKPFKLDGQIEIQVIGYFY